MGHNVRTQLRGNVEMTRQTTAPKKRTFFSNADLLMNYDAMCNQTQKKYFEDRVEVDSSAYDFPGLRLK
jgi:hypothetical protein